MPKTLVITIPQDDPSDLLLDVFFTAGIKEHELREDLCQDYFVIPVTALSPLWKQASGALSNGSLQYTRFMVERAKARAELPAYIKDRLKGYSKIQLPSCPAATILEPYFMAAGITIGD